MKQETDVLGGLDVVTAATAPTASPARVSPSDSPRSEDFLSGPSVRTRRFVLVVAALCVLVIVGMAQVWIRLRIVRMGYDLSAETRKAEKLQRLEHKLEVEQALLRRPERLRDVAAGRLGLREVRRGEVKVIHRGVGGTLGGL